MAAVSERMAAELCIQVIVRGGFALDVMAHRGVSGTRQFCVPRGSAAMWLTISGVAAITGALPYVLWRHRDRVGFIADWTIILVGSAVAAPMIGEIGTPAGSVSTGAGSGSAGAIIACSLPGLVIIVAGAAMARLRARR
jgi:integral membrane sensor domain MASE1